MIEVMEKEVKTDWYQKAENVVMMDSNRIGVGAILSPFVTITSNATIGSFFHANMFFFLTKTISS